MSESMFRILVTDDEEQMRDLLVSNLEKEGYETVTASNGLEAIERLKEETFHLVLLDVMMPELDGLTACMRIREFSNVPIILLTARSEELDRIHGLKIGADDYITKPFSPRELLARIEATLRRTHSFSKEQEATFDVGVLSIDIEGRTVSVKGKTVNLTRKEFDLLYLFITNDEKVFSREQLLDQIWGTEYHGNLRTVDTHIKTLRLKLGEAGGYIQTVWGIGYKFEANG
ncbi:response regulator transcription factor [Exiguobacterium profundum]|uniref:Response regulator transcription factor n=2 Tax=Exiguobacterium profundum TaxID=307643 RepID=A0ABY8B0K2_9BACL|nr:MULTISPECIES: response regulator transcription factor [Exiguobacterium]QPI67109.1 response regulator transcription factor [Exiguobacterium sp. PBE]MCT4797597.1 response regulator transcription factor [Exiguobacterium profundum]MCV9901116.1 response regulator transcription factor [Exiguobacterium sp. N5]MDT0193378.1 response regulator transcription factor [Exiguobacterium sp. BG5(2022)]WED54698.1 response regulator transcription factor [Exiguobacterium profundum]